MRTSTPGPYADALALAVVAVLARAALAAEHSTTAPLPAPRSAAALAQAAPTLAPVAVLTVPDPPLDNVGRPHGVALARDGTVHLYDQAARRIVALAPEDGRALRAFGGRRLFGVAGNDRHRGVGLAVSAGGDVVVVNGSLGQVQRFSAGGRAVSRWGPDGTDGTRFAAPGGLALDADGTLFVADAPAGVGQGRVYAIGADGRPRAGWGEALPAPFALQAPAGIATTRLGTVLVVDMAGGRVVEIAADGTPLRTFGALGEGAGAFRQPAAVAVEASGSIVVADLGETESRLLRFAADGTFRGRVVGGTALREPVGLAAADDGTLVVADADGAVVWLSPDGLTWREMRGRDGPSLPQIVDVAAAEDGAVAVLDVTLGQVVRFDARGRHVGQWGAPGTAAGALAVGPGTIGSVAAGPGGDIYVGDTANRVQRFSAGGDLRAGWDVTSGPNQQNGVHQLAVDAGGAFAVTHFGSQRVQLHDAAGTRLALWGLWGYRLPGRFIDPAGIALARDRVYVSDRSPTRPRIQAFDRTGRPVAAWGGATWGVCSPPSDAPVPPPVQPPPAYDELAAAPDGTIHAGRYPDGIAAFGADGQPRGIWGLDPFGRPYALLRYGLAFDAAGRAYLGDRGQQAVRVFAPAPERYWRAAWFDNRWLAGTPIIVTHVAGFAGDVAPPPGLPAADWSMRATRWHPLAGGAWRLTATGRGGARAWLADASLDRWDEAAFDGEAETRLPAGSWEAGVELQAPAESPAALTVRLEQVDAIPPPTSTPVVTMTASPTPAATGARATPTPPPTASSTPWAPPLPHRIALPITLAGGEVGPTPPLPARTATAPAFGGDPAIDVTAIDIDLTFDTAPRSVVAAAVTTTLRLRTAASGIAFNAEPEGIRMRAAAVDGRSTGWGWAPGAWGRTGTSLTRLHIPLGRRGTAGDVVVIRLDYDIPPDVRRRNLGLAGDGSQPAGRLTRGSPTFARWWLPSNDTPDDVAAFSAVLRVPATWQAVASGAPDAAFGGASGRLVGRDRRLVRFATGELATHQIAVAAGPFPLALRAVCLANAPAAPPDGADPADRADPADLDEPVPWTASPTCRPTERRVAVDLYNVPAGSAAITSTLDAIAWLDRHVAPWPHANVALVGGAHNMPLDRADVVNVAAQSSSFAAGEAAARAYFGDGVRVGDWDDVWIREGFTALLARFRTHDFELGPLCECRVEPLFTVGIDPADLLIARDRFGPVPATCHGAAAVLDLHIRSAAAVGLGVDAAPARRLMLAIVRDVHGSFDGRAVTTAQLVDHVAARLPAAYAAVGLAIDDAAARGVAAGWAERWGVADRR